MTDKISAHLKSAEIMQQEILAKENSLLLIKTIAEKCNVYKIGSKKSDEYYAVMPTFQINGTVSLVEDSSGAPRLIVESSVDHFRTSRVVEVTKLNDTMLNVYTSNSIYQLRIGEKMPRFI